jgi:hypothetical protein
VPLQCDEGPDFKTFRVGLFGLEKWHQTDRTVGQLAAALDRIGLVAPVAEAVAGGSLFSLQFSDFMSKCGFAVRRTGVTFNI